MTAIVWFKRDLRVHDHAPLVAASASPVVPLYIVEPEAWAQPGYAARQWDFVEESLRELDGALTALGAPLVRRSGDAVEVLEALRTHFGHVSLHSHQETGDGWSYARDRRVAAWARRHGVAWHQTQQNGVIRRLRSRDGWAKRWDAVMAQAQLPPPALTSAGATSDADGPSLAPAACAGRQPGGRQAGLALVDSFLAARGKDYRRAMSSPVTAFDECSRLSPHLAWGTLSSREVTQATWARQADLRTYGKRDGWLGSMNSYIGRLHWRCHFMQKLEDEPEIEHRCLHPGYEGMRDGADPARLAAWTAGQTGWPMVDACMRALDATGYLNFRMRAMVTAIAAYHLWMDWRVFGPVLGRMFTDYEPGIHFSQLQMQSGVTGMNTVRIYNPIKQGLDHDPDGVFIRRWCPELADVPASRLHEPWKMTEAEQAEARCVLGRDYPRPLVDHVAAARAAKEAVYARRRDDAFQQIKTAVLAKHASRKRTAPRRRDDRQSSFDF